MDVPRKFWRFVTGTKVLVLGTAFLFLVQCVGFSTVTLSDEITLEERQHYQAQQLREASKLRAQSHLGYENIYRDPRSRQIDFYALTQQINHLSNIVNTLANQQVQEKITSPPQSLPRALNPVASSLNNSKSNIYGPSGPSEKAVRLLLEYQLMINGNDRLKVGDIKGDSENIIAEVVTIDGSLVERYKINKKNGNWGTD